MTVKRKKKIGSTIEQKSTKAVSPSVSIYNIKGQKVRDYRHISLSKGKNMFNWDGVSDDGFRVPSGTYLLKIEYDNKTLTKKMAVID